MKGGRNACSTVSLICLNYRKPALTKILRPLELIKAGFVESWGEGSVVSPGRGALSFVRRRRKENRRKQEETSEGGLAAEYSYIVINPLLVKGVAPW